MKSLHFKLLTVLIFVCYLVFIFVLSPHCYCEGTGETPAANFPLILEFHDLHLSDGLKTAISTLKGVAGVYAIVHKMSGKVYIGSSMNIGLRLTAHLIYGSCNPHLSSALELYGLSEFMIGFVQEYYLDPTSTDDENAPENNLLFSAKCLRHLGLIY